jgi:hypothetical protein
VTEYLNGIEIGLVVLLAIMVWVVMLGGWWGNVD